MLLKPIFAALPATVFTAGLLHQTPTLANETATNTANQTVKLQAVTVEADFREEDIQQSSNSVTVVTPVEMEERNAQNLEDVIGLMPNVNASSGASHANYFQIRGMGVTEQFTTPINPSVGVLVDDFDYSQTGAAATMFDVKQVDVLRGPQGTRFGASALAGVIAVESNEANYQPAARLEGTVGSHNTYAGGVMLNGPIIDDTLAGRLAVYQYNSDGYIDNDHLDKHNTQKNDELTARANLKWDVNDRLTLDLKLLHINIDNGYDAFNFDNGTTTLSDNPGQDSLKTDGLALKADYAMTNAVDMVAVVTQTQSKSVYSYDADWAYTGFSPTHATQTDYAERKRSNQSLDLRFLSSENGRIFNNTTEWVAGLYYLKQDEKYQGHYVYDDYHTNYYEEYPSGYRYNTESKAAYGQLDHHLTSKWTLIAGLRAELYSYDYDGTVTGFRKKADETLYGGKVGARYQINPNHLSFVTLSRGYKPGGVNDDSQLPADEVVFDTEYLWNLEGGLNSSLLNNRLNTRLNVFYGWRKDQQLQNSKEEANGDWILWTDNAAESEYYGLEAQGDWLIVDDFRALASLGLLHSTFTDYTYKGENLDGRDVERAPSYTFNLGGEYYLNHHWTWSANIEGKDAYYFSNTKPQKSKAYSLVNSALTYQRKAWTVTLWGKNLGDTQYATQGFYFNADPRTPDAALYTQQGAPRTYGVTVAYDY
ncbi:MAG: TonB-dependent receptor [Hydrogenovibrio sp.]